MVPPAVRNHQPACGTHLTSSQKRTEVLGCATNSSGGKRQRRLGFISKCLPILASLPTHWHPGLRFGLLPAPGVQNLFAPQLLLLGAVVCEINTAYRSCALATNGVKMQAGKSLSQTHIFVRLKRSCFSPRILKQQAVRL